MTGIDMGQAAQILEGVGGNDYERYIRTDELLALQKGPDEWLHRDELLFTVTHQSSELWLKLAVSEIGEACCRRVGSSRPSASCTGSRCASGTRSCSSTCSSR